MDSYSRRTTLKIESIMIAATKLFEEYGYEKVSVDEIAHNAKTSKATVYKYFQSKENLFKEVMDRTLKEYVDASEKIILDSCDFKSKLTKIIQLKLKYYKMSNNVFSRHLHPFDNNNEQLKRSWKLHQVFHDQGRNEGCICDALSDEDISDYFEIVIHGMLKKYEHDTITERKIEDLTNIVYYGILKREK